MTPGAPSVSSPGASSSPPAPPLYNYSFSTSNTDFKRGLLDFFFHFPSSPVDLYVARLNIKAGSGIPPDWYRRIKPFSFRVLDIVNQRGGATILNNVIDPSRGERTFLRYNLSRGGRVTIQVFTLDGNLVKVLQRGNQSSSGEAYTVEWNGRNEGGNIVARGMYFIRIVGPDIDEIRKVMVIR
jgi:hypothetical protein